MCGDLGNGKGASSSFVMLKCSLCEHSGLLQRTLLFSRLFQTHWFGSYPPMDVSLCVRLVKHGRIGTLCPSRDSGRAWSTLFFAVVWTIWEVRNHKVFSDAEPDFSIAMDTIQFRTARWIKHHGCGSLVPLASLLQNVSEFCKDPLKSKKQASEPWVPPVAGSLKFNVDGSSRGQPGSSGIGGVLRNNTGMVQCLFSLFVGNQDSITAELMAIDYACSLCVANPSLRVVNIEIVSDSLLAVTWINSDQVGSLAYVNMVMVFGII
ncbi:hypothetical protein LWI29_017220 [Acer saccharum]|uniref:RNase H type-1 domain-containing protein n=1 Tax=Acer saccharum TaxID=4024 RepID=A0AA39TCP9_ACESA|nr:hypothetical protein LWI29_017220 [Acer saccharum]